jgi:hypothetical protein
LNSFEDELGLSLEELVKQWKIEWNQRIKKKNAQKG